MREELKNLTIKLHVSNIRTERLMNNFDAAKELLKQIEICLIQELKIDDDLANKIRLELLLDDAIKAQTE